MVLAVLIVLGVGSSLMWFFDRLKEWLCGVRMMPGPSLILGLSVPGPRFSPRPATLYRP